jgi:hypothetical protein
MPLPSWLDPTTEIKNNQQPEAYKKLDDLTKSVVFILCSYKSLRKCNSSLTTEQIFWIIGNFVSETGWGKYWNGYNFGGWKINKAYADSYKKRYKVSAPWYQDEGHVASGDEAIVYYRGYVEPLHFYREWVERFVPSVPNLKDKRYNETGEAFWKPSSTWFLELCLAGYKGPVTQSNPNKSVESWEKIVNRSQVIVTQHLLGVKVDASWGAKSSTACLAFQNGYNLVKDGKPNFETLGLLLKQWEDKGCPLFVKL